MSEDYRDDIREILNNHEHGMPIGLTELVACKLNHYMTTRMTTKENDMKEKIDTIVRAYIGSTLTQSNTEWLKEQIEQLIKDTDQMARARCADAVKACDGEMDADIKLISANDAARACLNA